MIALALVVLFGGFYALRASLYAGALSRAGSSLVSGGPDRALADYLFAGVLDEGSGDDNARVERAGIFFRARDLDAAERELADRVRAGSTDVRVYVLLGKVENARGNFNAADEYFAQAVWLDPSPENLILRAKNLVRAGAGTQAAVLIADRRKTDSSADLGYYAALIDFDRTGKVSDQDNFRRAGRAEELSALLAYDTAGAFSRSYALVDRAKVFVSLGEPDFAYADALPVTVKEPGYADAWLILGESYLLSGDRPAAAAALEKCVALDSNRAEAWSWLGRTYAALGEKEKAAAAEARYGFLTK